MRRGRLGAQCAYNNARAALDNLGPPPGALHDVDTRHVWECNADGFPASLQQARARAFPNVNVGFLARLMSARDSADTWLVQPLLPDDVIHAITMACPADESSLANVRGVMKWMVPFIAPVVLPLCAREISTSSVCAQ